MASRRFQIDQLIINSPYEEPASYWRYVREVRMFERVEGSRRPAGYLVATPGSKGFDDPGVFVELPLVNQIRPRIKAWREAGWPGVTGTTRRLLEHWTDLEERAAVNRRFFFCQLEAIETLIWLTEADPAERQGIVIPGDGGNFARLCCKLATGTGKTIVMAMLIAWQTLNKTVNAQDTRFAKNVLVVAPGLTVRERLRVLVPDSPNNYYDEFNIIPGGLDEQLRQGKVRVINWHKLEWDTPAKLARKKSVDKRGAKSDEAYVREAMGDMAQARNLLVINDEAHHAWRILPGESLRGIARQDAEEATKWIGGLDRIHRARGIQTCYDFSATPFVPSGKKATEEALFGWIVSDFGLNDAIEAGLVKTPRVVVRDDGKLSKEYKSRFYHLYSDLEVKDNLNRAAEPHEPLPDLVSNGYGLLGKDWLEAKKAWARAGLKTPPVLITVANRIETAARIEFAFNRGKILIDELCDPERMLRIDSKALDKAETLDEPEDAPEDEPSADAEGENGDADAPLFTRKLTKKEELVRLRRVVSTVGQVGQPGELLQNVISVGMLSEGWDAKTVTHIMGLRAFSSQLLCEQVVGRGLRRTSYEVNPGTGLFEAEYVNIFGVPFTFLPHEESDGPPPPPPPPKTKIEPVKEREREFGISWPNIVRIEHVYRPSLSLDLAKVGRLELDAQSAATQAELAATIEGKPDLTKLSEIDLKELAAKFRLQRIIFQAAVNVFEQMRSAWQKRGRKDILLAQLIRLVEQVLESDRIVITPELFQADPLRRRIVLALNMNRIVQHIWEAIRFENTNGLEAVFDSQRPIASTGDMRPWFTSRPCEHTKLSHINLCVYDSKWEASEAHELDHNGNVSAWVKNDHLGFEVVYIFKGVVRKYRPDFLVRLKNGPMLVLEIKGQQTDEARAKREFLAEWVKAVNAHGGFGRWECAVSTHPADVAGILLEANRRNGEGP